MDEDENDGKKMKVSDEENKVEDRRKDNDGKGRMKAVEEGTTRNGGEKERRSNCRNALL